MVRPKRPFSGNTEITMFTEEERQRLDSRHGRKEVRERQRTRKIVYRLRNGFGDPISVLLVLDSLLWLREDIELRANPLTEWLNANMKHVVWDTVTVGKILADLCLAFEDKLGEKRGLMWRSIDHRGRFYIMNRTDEVMALAAELRKDLVRLVDIEVAVREQGKTTDFGGSPLFECPSVAIGEIPS